MPDCNCEALYLADVAHVDQLSAEAVDPATSDERRREILDQFRREVWEMTIAIAKLMVKRARG